MILDKTGQTFMYGNSCYHIGQEIVANAKSDYAGLSGVIIEIRDDDDKGTDNATPDIYCCFTQPDDSRFIALLEQRFSDPMDEIALDCVIMGPEMIEPKTEFQINPMDKQLYILNYYTDCDDENDFIPLGISLDLEFLKTVMQTHISGNEHLKENDGFSIYDYYSNGGYVWTAEHDTNYINYTIDPVPYLIPDAMYHGGAV